MMALKSSFKVTLVNSYLISAAFPLLKSPSVAKKITSYLPSLKLETSNVNVCVSVGSSLSLLYA